MSEQKHLIKIHCLYIYTWFCSLCQALLTLGGFNSLTLSHWGGWPRTVPSQKVSTGFQVSLYSRISYLLGRVKTVWGPLYGKCHEVCGICIQDEVVTQNIGQNTHSIPPCCELAISRMKRGGVDVIMAGCISKVSLV